ncbi:hypothetical protein I6E11_12240 [Bacteroides caecigallinarum]|nr:hypothetical protein [Bacteroides caecigallinarum]
MRQYRELSDMTKKKISQAMKGKSKSITHREAISNSLKDYWKTVPNKPAQKR